MKQHSKYNYSQQNHCSDCKKLITNRSKKCSSCSNKRRIFSKEHKKKISLSHKDKKNGRYIDGRTNKKYYCIDCDKKIIYKTWKYGNPRCQSCANSIKSKGILNPMYGIRLNKELNGNWKGGISFEPYSLGWTKIFKEQIRYRDKYKCQICGCPEIECDRKLDVHHIDYDKQNINSENLISLCQNCHLKTNGNRNYWYAYFIYITEEKYEKL